MSNKYNFSSHINIQSLRNFIICIFFMVFIPLVLFFKFKAERYSFFIELNDASGVKVGTPIRMRGINIGSIQNIKLKLNCVLVLVIINSKNILIGKDSIIETSQTGLLNDTVIDIIPIKDFNDVNKLRVDPLSSYCHSSEIICHDMYLFGDRGLNYDDLVRATTRISQRFDDPRFFKLFYLLLYNSIELTEIFSDLLTNILSIAPISSDNIYKLLSSNLS